HEHADPGQAGLAVGAVGVRLAAVRELADPVDALHAGHRTVGRRLAQERRHTAAARAGPVVVAVGARAALRRLADAEVAALPVRAVGVDGAVRPRDADPVGADGSGGAVAVGAAVLDGAAL